MKYYKYRNRTYKYFSVFIRIILFLLILTTFVTTASIAENKDGKNQIAASITVTSPNGGEEVCGGQNLRIQWNYSDINNVRIVLSSDGGMTWPIVLIEATDAAPGLWTWRIPDDQQEGYLYRIKVMDAINFAVNDASNQNFKIYRKTGISNHPENLSVCLNATATFTVTAVGTGLEYQWRKDGVDIKNATTRTYYINKATESDEGTYTCIVRGTCDSVISDGAKLKITTPVKITSTTPDDSICVGQTANISIIADGTGMSYAWSRNGKHIPGSNVSELVLQNVTKADSGIYICIVSGACQSKDTSRNIHLVVLTPAIFTEQPESQTVIEGSFAELRVLSPGTDIQYQWRKNGVILQDSVRNILSFEKVTKADSGSYDCIISNKCNKLTSKTAVLNVVSEEKPILELLVSNVDFGNVNVGKTRDTLLSNVIKNNSRMPLTISEIKITGRDAGDFNFFGIKLPFTIPAEEQRSLNLEFVPASTGAKLGTVNFTSNASNIATISLIGYGTNTKPTLQANDWNYGEVLLGDNPISANIITNIGTNDVTIEKPIVMSYDSLNFKLLDAEDFPATLKSGESITAKFMFIPTIPKSYEVTVLVANSTNDDLWFKLKGTGVMTDVNQYTNESGILTPNPASDYIYINISQQKSTYYSKNIKIYNYLGLEQKNISIEFLMQDLIRINLTDLTPGLYFVSVQGTMMKFIKL